MRGLEMGDEKSGKNWGGTRKGAGRPKLKKGEALTASLEVPMTQADKDFCIKTAGERPVGAWARDILLSVAVARKGGDPLKELERITLELKRRLRNA